MLLTIQTKFPRSKSKLRTGVVFAKPEVLPWPSGEGAVVRLVPEEPRDVEAANATGISTITGEVGSLSVTLQELKDIVAKVEASLKAR